MFAPTRSLQKRVEARLRGFRWPAIKILRQAIARVDPAARSRPFDVPRVEPLRNLSTEMAWGMADLPLRIWTRESRWIVPTRIGGAARYIRPETECWAHSVYKYNKSAIKTLSATTTTVAKGCSTYLNMMPRFPSHRHGSTILSPA